MNKIEVLKVEREIKGTRVGVKEYEEVFYSNGAKLLKEHIVYFDGIKVTLISYNSKEESYYVVDINNNLTKAFKSNDAMRKYTCDYLKSLDKLV